MTQQTHSLKERLLAFFMAFALVFGMLPTVTWAGEEETPTAPTATIQYSSGTTTLDLPSSGLTLDPEVKTVTLSLATSGTTLTDASIAWSVTSGNEAKFDLTGVTSEAFSATLKTPLEENDSETLELKVVYSYTEESVAKEVQATGKIIFQGPEAVTFTPSITLNSSDKVSLEVGDTSQINASVANDTAGTVLTYASDDTSVATVDSLGKITAKGAGTAEITVGYTNAESKTVAVTVKEKVVAPVVTLSSISLSIDEKDLDIGKTSKVTVTAKYSDNSTKDVTDSATTALYYNFNPTGIASITGSTVSALAAGETALTATYKEDGVEKTSSVTVTVTNPSIEDVSGIVTTMYLSHNGSAANNNFTTLSTTNTKTALLNLRMLDANGNAVSNSEALGQVEWTVSNGSTVVSMTTVGTSSLGDRIFTAVGAGQAVVTATYGSISCEFKITVSGITVDATAVAGGMLTHSTSGVITVSTYGDASGVTWVSRNSGLISIEYQDEAQTQAILKTNDSTGTGVIDITSTDGSTSFSVTVEEAIASHIIPVYNVNNINVLRFSDLESEFYARTEEIYPGETLVNLQSVEVAPAHGTLYMSYQNEDNPGAGLASSGSFSFTGYPSAKDIVFVPNGSYTGSVAIIKYTGKTNLDHTFYGEIHANLASIDDVYTSTGTKEPVSLDSYSFAQIAANSGKTIDYVVFSIPDENRAVMYYDYKDSSNFHHVLLPGEQLDKNDLDKITVIPAGGFVGELAIPYVIYATDGSTLIGEVSVYIDGYGPEGPIVYNTIAGEYITLITEDFHTNVQAITGYSMNYVTFELPSASQGTLYELYYSDSNYRRIVTSDTTYYASARSPQISEVSFVPAPGFTGSCEIRFTGYDMLGNSYQGTIEVNVGSQTTGDINYICSAGSYVPFYDGDFNQFSRSMTGYNVDYISFPTLPSTASGALRLGQTSYHDGVSVTAGTKYYYDDSPLLSKLSFAATSGFTGMVTVPFEGVSVGGTPFAGTLTIVVTNQNLVKIPYTATYYSPATFNSDDFEHYALERTGSSLDYVRFELPLDTNGILYYNYSGEDNYSAVVDASTNYYVNQSSYLNYVSFVPDRNFQGTVQIPFTAWSENGQSFSGIISVYVADGGDPLSYYMYTGEYLYLNSAAFQDFCYDETGSNLNYVTINFSDSSKGYLYQEYDPNSSTKTAVSSTTKLYKSQSPYISNLAFVPTPGYLGTVTLPFTATATDGGTCSGTVTILVRPSEANSGVYYYTSFSPIQLNEDDIYEVWSSETIDYIEIHNTPTATQGKLYYENNLSSFATTTMKYYTSGSETGPYINQMVFAPRAGFSGTMIVSYTATTSSGRSFSGDICVVVTTGQPSLYFDDMNQHLWATASADYLYLTQVSTGVSNRKFAPSNNITRGDFALMLQKAFRFTASDGEGFADVNPSAYYASAVNTLRSLGITTGYANNSFKPEDFISRQDAMMMLYTAMSLAQKGVQPASNSVLNQFSDSGMVASYAQSSMAAMVAGGLISGSGGKLHPEQNMTRAEMAVVLHQAMTY